MLPLDDFHVEVERAGLGVRANPIKWMSVLKHCFVSQAEFTWHSEN